MSGYLLFRRVRVGNRDYYQLYQISKTIPKDKNFGDFDTRKQNDFFYIENPNLDQNVLYDFFFDDEKGEFDSFSVDKKDFNKIYNIFKNKFNDFDNENNYILFRRIEMNGKNYYQVFDVVDKAPNKEYADYFNRQNSELFYLKDGASKSDVLIHQLFYDNENNELENLPFEKDKDEYINTYNMFKEKYHDLGELSISEVKSVDEITRIINKKILFEEKAIRNLVTKIYLNQLVLASNLPDELKKSLKRNIVFHGIEGTGKNTICNLLIENLNLPYADITITKNLQDIVTEICKNILEKSNNTEEANSGIVFIRDNFGDLIDLFGGEEKVYHFIRQLTRIGVATYKGYEIDFNKLTFVLLYNQECLDNYEILGVCEETGFDSNVEIKPLTLKQKKEVLLSENGRITEYAKFLDDFDKKFYINDESLRKLISFTHKIDPGMTVLNKAIDLIVQRSIKGKINNVHINKDVVDFIYDFLGGSDMDYEPITPKNDLDNLCEKVGKVVIGQEKATRKLLYNILKNLEMANNPRLATPSEYIKKILIQTESGGGKTLLLTTIARYLHAPIYIADATKYTEAGFKGDDVEDMLLNLYNNAGGNIDKAERGILVIDEIDKKSNSGNDIDVSRGAVQNALLKIFDGSTFYINISNDKRHEEIIPFNTSRLTIICSGAFENIEKIRDKRIRSENGGMGFRQETKKVVDDKISYDDYINYGMIKQFMARMKVFINLEKNTKESLINIMKNSIVSALKVEQERLKEDDIEIEYTEDFYEKLAEKALSYNIGARGIGRAFEEVLSNICIEDINKEEIKKIILNGECVDNNEELVLVKREKVKIKRK